MGSSNREFADAPVETSDNSRNSSFKFDDIMREGSGNSISNRNDVQANPVSKDGKLDFGSFDNLYGSQNLSKPAAVEAAGAAYPVRPFSAADINNSGNVAADMLKNEPHDKGQNAKIDQIYSHDKTQAQLNQDIDTFRKSGAMGGVQQFAEGDCWFQASLAAVAGTPGGAEKISNMIASNPAGGYTVTYPSHPLNVSQNEVDGNTKISGSAEWDKVLQAAMLKEDPKGYNGGTMEYGLHLLTGKQAQDLPLAIANQAQISSSIESALAQGKPVTAGTTEQPADPIRGHHVYTVTAYDANTNTITLRNPWGDNPLSPGTQENGVNVGGAGFISMPMDVFMKNYKKVSIAA
jgi:hypothetical protein